MPRTIAEARRWNARHPKAHSGQRAELWSDNPGTSPGRREASPPPLPSHATGVPEGRWRSSGHLKRARPLFRPAAVSKATALISLPAVLKEAFEPALARTRGSRARLLLDAPAMAMQCRHRRLQRLEIRQNGDFGRPWRDFPHASPPRSAGAPAALSPASLTDWAVEAARVALSSMFSMDCERLSGVRLNRRAAR